MTTEQRFGPSKACLDCGDIPLRPRHWRAWSPQERTTWLRSQEVTLVRIAAEHRLSEVLRQVPAEAAATAREARMEADALEGEQYCLIQEILSARLRRYLPQYADLITWAIDEDCTWHDDRGPLRDDDDLPQRG